MRIVSFVIALTTAACAGDPATEPDAPDEGGAEAVRIVFDSDGVSAIVADDHRIYYTSWGGRLMSADHDGEDVVLLADTRAYHLAADATHLYWTTARDIRRVSKAGGGVQIVARLREASNGLAAALWLAVDDEYVYASTYDDGTVVRAPKTGGSPEVVARVDGTMGPIDVADGRLYWSEYGWSTPVIEQNLQTGQLRTFSTAGPYDVRRLGDDLWVVEVADDGVATRLVRVPLDGSQPVGYPGVSMFAGDDGHDVYWMPAQGELDRIDPATGGSEALPFRIPGRDLEDIAIAGGWVFLTDGAYPGGIYRLPADPDQ
jgi:hypothetical protein